MDMFLNAKESISESRIRTVSKRDDKQVLISSTGNVFFHRYFRVLEERLTFPSISDPTIYMQSLIMKLIERA